MCTDTLSFSLQMIIKRTVKRKASPENEIQASYQPGWNKFRYAYVCVDENCIKNLRKEASVKYFNEVTPRTLIIYKPRDYQSPKVRLSATDFDRNMETIHRNLGGCRTLTCPITVRQLDPCTFESKIDMRSVVLNEGLQVLNHENS